VVSAVEPEAVAQLHAAIMAVFRKRLAKASLFLPWSAQNLRGQVFASCEVVEEQSDADGTFFTVRAERKDIDALRERIGPEARRKPPG
jgi:GTP-binding protein HflX